MTQLVLDALEMALRQHDRDQHLYVRGELIHHSDAGSQYTSFRLAEHLDAAGLAASIGSVGDARPIPRLHRHPVANFYIGTSTVGTTTDPAWHTHTGPDAATSNVDQVKLAAIPRELIEDTDPPGGLIPQVERVQPRPSSPRRHPRRLRAGKAVPPTARESLQN